MFPALKYTVRHYGRNYSVISEQSECGRLCFYATIESLYGANHFTVTVRKQNGNFSMTPTVYVCGQKKYLNCTLVIDSPFQTFAVGLLVEFIN